MANSSYYRSKYNDAKKKAKDYEKNIESLEKIYTSLTDKLGNEVSNVNKQLGELKDDLGKSVRHNSAFSNNADSASQKREPSSSSDSKLSSAAGDIQDEIRSLKRKKSDAESDEAYYKRKYEEAKDEERQEFLDKINIFK